MAPSLLPIVAVVLLASCSLREGTTDGAPELEVQLAIEPSPARVGQADLVISLHTPDGNALEGARIEVKGDMSHAGMTPVLGQSVPQAPGIYRIPFEWTMAGDWVLTLSGALPEGRRLHRTFRVLVHPPPAVP